MTVLDYDAFLRAKMVSAKEHGIEIDADDIHPLLKPHQRDIVKWAVRGGRRAIFAKFGLGKTFMQLETARIIQRHAGGRFLIVAPLGVRQEFMRDAHKLGITLTFARRIEECPETGLVITNYETMRDGKLSPHHFRGVSLDEAAVLRGFGGTKTFREFMRLFEGIPYKFVATATPSPNEYIELLAYAAFLEIMDVGEAKTRFFKRDSTKADKLTLHPHKADEFWLWCASWAIFLQQPGDLGYPNDGYDLPPLEVVWHEIPDDHSQAQAEVDGQFRLLKQSAIGVVNAAREKRTSLAERVHLMGAILEDSPDVEQWVIWCDLNDEQRAIERELDARDVSYASIYGALPIEDREQLLESWRDKQSAALVSKPVMLGSGVNLQQCHRAIFSGIGFKFSDFIQAVHRVYRFLQDHPVRIDIIYTESEREVRRILERKWEDHNIMMERMSGIIEKYGLARQSIDQALQRSIGVERIEVRGDTWTAINNDCVEETRRMESDSVGLVVSSIPFSTQYEYTPSYNDFGHTDSNTHFFEQMDYLTPELLRVLKPGRIAAIHVKDRIVPGGMTGLGFQTCYPFHARTIDHFTRHGFAYMGMKTIVTDVVRENNQTYRLGWSEQCKDGTKMGVGMPEYLLIFRKPPSQNENSYADEPVVKHKPPCVSESGAVVKFDPNLPILPGAKGHYSRSRWQIDAHGYAKSSGDRTITPEDVEKMSHREIFQLFREYSRSNVYDYEYHVALCEAMEGRMRLPVTFMLLQPGSWSDDVWDDVTRMLSLNTIQAAKGAEMHLCPMQFDIADRAITSWSNKGDVVYDPFGGLGTVAYRAVLLERQGRTCELNPRYFFDSVQYLRAAETKVGMPSLFDLPDTMPAQVTEDERKSLVGAD